MICKVIVRLLLTKCSISVSYSSTIFSSKSYSSSRNSNKI